MRNEYVLQILVSANLKEIENLGDLSFIWMYNSKEGLEKIWCESVDWIKLAQDSIQLRAVVITVMSHQAS
jgi:hypothetical protein